MTDQDFARRALIATGIVAFVALVVLAAWDIVNLLLILFGSILFAVFLRAFADPLARHTPLPSWAALLSVLIGMAALVAGGAWLVGPDLVDQVSSLADELPRSMHELQRTLVEAGWLEPGGEGTTLWSRLRAELGSRGSSALSWASRVIGGVASTVAELAVAMVVGVYLAAQPALYRWGVANLTPPQSRQHVIDVGHTLDRQLRGWLLGQLAAMVFVGVLTGVGLWIIGYPLILALAVVAFLLTFVPNLGPLTTLVVAVLVGLVQAPEKVAWAVALYVGVQILETYLFTPLVQRRTASIPPALLLATQLMFGALFGIMGLLFAAPLTVAGMVAVRRLYREDVLGEPPPEGAPA